MELLTDMPIVNVSSVSHRSPFRYPGGKTWLVPFFCAWLRSLAPRPRLLVEPFAGGATISLAAASERLVDHVIFAEKDEAVSSVWQTILDGNARALAKRIIQFPFSPENVAAALEAKPASRLDLAWQTLLRNRVQRGGILAPGAGKIKAGDNSRGLGARWYPKTLSHRIEAIELLKSRLSFTPGDGMELLAQHADNPEAAFYIDPPYLVAAKRLYCHWQVDHENLFQQAANCRGAVLMSYDAADEIRDLARRFKFSVKVAEMKNTHHTRQRELLIFKAAQA
jgi:DNA adenine methylase